LNDKVKGVLDKVTGFFKKLSKRTIILLCVAAVVVVGVIIALIVHQSNRPYVMLFTELNTEDMSKVVTYLEESGAGKYRIEGDTIWVPESEENRLRVGLLSNQIYPQSGFSYSTYLDNVGMLSSESDREQLRLYELQDRLGAVISLLNGVQNAVVTITPQEDNRWILDSEKLTKASAQAVVTMRDGYKMDSQMATSIQNLLLTGVQGLKVENAVVMDQDGKTWTGSESIDASDSSALMLSLQNQADERIRNKVLDLLVPIYGAENVRVGVNTTVDVSKNYEESVTYKYPEETAWNSLGGHGLIDEWVWDNSLLRGDEGGVGGVVGTTTNADLNEYVTQQIMNDTNAQQIGASGSVTHKYDTTTTQRENYGGVVTDVMVSVAINSDGFSDTNLANTEGIVPLVARASGISQELQGEKIVVVLRPFRTEQEPTPEPPAERLLADWMIYAMIAGFALFLLLLVLILVLRSKSKKRKAAALAAQAEAQAQAQAAELIPAMAGGPPTSEEGAQIMDIQAERTMELRQDVRKFVEDNPEIAAQMVKSWLRGGEESSG